MGETVESGLEFEVTSLVLSLGKNLYPGLAGVLKTPLALFSPDLALAQQM
jgi:hypothetical protein